MRLSSLLSYVGGPCSRFSRQCSILAAAKDTGKISRNYGAGRIVANRGANRRRGMYDELRQRQPNRAVYSAVAHSKRDVQLLARPEKE